MTFTTQRDYVQRTRIIWMMIIMCLFLAFWILAYLCRWFWQLTRLNSITNIIAGMNFFFVSGTIFCLISSYGYSIFGSAFFGFLILCGPMVCTSLTFRIITGCTIFPFVKMRYGFFLLAITTSFCLNSLRHDLISGIKLCLEPILEAPHFLSACFMLRRNCSYVK
jgi:hypothetical protein